MNYRRGLQRLFAAFTVVWIVAAFLDVFSGRSQPPWLEGLAVVRTLPIGTTFNFPLAGWSGAVWLWAIGLSLVPPLIVYLVLFYAVPWSIEASATQKLQPKQN